MNVIELIGRINQEGKLEVELPEGTPPGEVRVRIERPEHEPMADDAIEALLKTDPAPGSTIVAAGLTGGWQGLGISDGQAWVDEHRRQRKARRAW